MANYTVKHEPRREGSDRRAFKDSNLFGVTSCDMLRCLFTLAPILLPARKRHRTGSLLVSSSSFLSLLKSFDRVIEGLKDNVSSV